MNELVTIINLSNPEKTLKQNSDQLFVQVYSVFKDYCFQISFNITQCRQASEDISQDVFLRLWCQKEQLGSIKNVKAFIGISARNSSIDYVRKQKKVHLFLVAYTKNQKFHFDLNEQFDKKETEQLLHLAIQSLSLQRRTVFVSGWMEGYTRDEIATQLSISPNTVRNLMQQARHDIQIFFAKQTGMKRVSVLKMMKHVWHKERVSKVA